MLLLVHRWCGGATRAAIRVSAMSTAMVAAAAVEDGREIRVVVGRQEIALMMLELVLAVLEHRGDRGRHRQRLVAGGGMSIIGMRIIRIRVGVGVGVDLLL